MATDPRVQEFLNSPAYRDFQQSQLGMGHTMDMYDSPYFGSIGSGSRGRAQDAAYSQWLSQNYDAQGNRINTDPVTGTPTEYDTTELDPSSGAIEFGNSSGATRKYFEDNPDVAAAFQKNTYDLTPDQFARAHYERYGQSEGRNPMPVMDTPGGEFATTAIDPSESTLSPNFANYVYSMLARGEQAANLPFQEYTGERFAGPSDLQQQAFADYAGMAEPSQFDEATGIARLAAQQAQGLGYAPGQFTADQISPQELQQYQMAGPRDVSAERVSAPDLQDLSMQAAAPVSAERVGAQDITAAQTEYRPDLQAFQMQTPEERVTAESFAQPGAAEALMSPYIQGVIDKQTREALRQADIARGGRGARFAQAGAFGGSRQAIEESEAERNLQTQLGDITATGLQAAYQQAQEQFNQEQQARQAAQQANIGTGLTVGLQNLAAQLGVQQLGTQTGLQTALANLSNQQQAAVQNEANRLQAQGMNQQQALQAALANQGVTQQANLQNLSAALQTQGLGAQTGMESQRLNQATGLQALLANQQMGYNTEAQNLAALLGIQQLGAQQGLTAQQLNQQYGLEAQRLGEQSRQFGAGYGLQGIGQQINAGQLMSGIGAQAGNYGLQGLQGLLAAGGIQQQLAQQPYDFGYQQWQQSQQYPYQQATYMQSLLGGLPLQAASYNPGTSAFGNALAGTATGLGIYGLLNQGTTPTTGTTGGK